LAMQPWVAVPGEKDTVDERLIRAARAGNLAQVKTFLDQGLDVNATGKDGSIALVRAAGAGNLEVVKVFLENGADVNAIETEGWSALTHAPWSGGSAGFQSLVLPPGCSSRRVQISMQRTNRARRL